MFKITKHDMRSHLVKCLKTTIKTKCKQEELKELEGFVNVPVKVKVAATEREDQLQIELELLRVKKKQKKVKIYSCAYCFEVFISWTDLKKHTWVHSLDCKHCASPQT